LFLIISRCKITPPLCQKATV